MFTIEVLCRHCDENHREVVTFMDFGARTVQIDRVDYSDYSSSTDVTAGPVMTFEALRDALDRGADLLGSVDRQWTPADEDGEINMALSKYLAQWCALGFPAYLADMTYNACCGEGFDEISEAFLADTPHFKSLAAIAEDALLKSLKW